MKPAVIGLTYDLRSDYLKMGFTELEVAEFDSDYTINALEATIRDLGYRTDRIGHAKALCQRLAAGDRWDLVFNIAEGWRGRSREAQVPALLELYDIPYTFSDPLTCAVTLDKEVAKKVVREVGVLTPRSHVVAQLDDLRGLALSLPLFAKPIAEGTSKGIDAKSRIDSREQLAGVCADLLQRYCQPVLVEEYLPGREFTVGMLGTGADARVVGIMEVSVAADADGGIYSFATKEQCEQFVKYAALREEPLRTAVADLALRAFRGLECRDGGRVDVKLDAQGRPQFLEINPLAGLHPEHSDLPIIATLHGMSYKELLGGIIASACQRLEAPAHA